MIVVGQLRMRSPRPNLLESGELSENILLKERYTIQLSFVQWPSGIIINCRASVYTLRTAVWNWVSPITIQQWRDSWVSLVWDRFGKVHFQFRFLSPVTSFKSTASLANAPRRHNFRVLYGINGADYFYCFCCCRRPSHSLLLATTTTKGQ